MAFLKIKTSGEVKEFTNVTEAMKFFDHPCFPVVFIPSDTDHNCINVCADTNKKTVIAEIVE